MGSEFARANELAVVAGMAGVGFGDLRVVCVKTPGDALRDGIVPGEEHREDGFGLDLLLVEDR